MENNKKWIDPGTPKSPNGMKMTPKYYLLEMCMLAGILAFYVFFSSQTTFTVHNLVLFLPCMGLVWASDAFVYQLYLTYEVKPQSMYYEGVQVPFHGKND